MGIQDRDWYWEERAKKERAALRSQASAPAEHDDDTAPKAPPKLIGADWHWTLQLLVWLCIVTLLLAIFRMLR